ncbi:hypothetical protein B0H14DRAFT_3574836 [Mycena olivaceomarginata]|nr:hypothetical protein B0H14DRAFT_3574836 [Mycena olivaceomarginata]
MPFKRRYNPYPYVRTPTLPRPPAPSLQTKELLKEASEQLEFYNHAGVMVTWAANDWEITDSQNRKTHRFLLALHPSPLSPNLYIPPALTLTTTADLVIPKVRPSVYSTGDSSDGPDDPDHEHHAVDQTRTSPAASSSSTEQVEDLILWDPRVPSSTGTTPTSSPTPTPLRAKGPTLHSSRYSESVARARAISDVRILDVCWDGLFSGQFETSPSSHLAFPKPGVPTHWVLQPYDEKFYPGCLTRTFQELKFLGTDIGQALRALNSTFGVTCDVLAEIIDDCSTCMGCKCRFSRDGFNDHIRAGLCGNWPTPSTIAHVPRPERLPHDLALRELPPGKQLGTSAEFLDSPIGAALMEWNSRLGVPLDVWALASTATTECSTCHLYRTFPAHAAHLHTVTGVCNDLVDEAAGAE